MGLKKQKQATHSMFIRQHKQRTVMELTNQSLGLKSSITLLPVFREGRAPHNRLFPNRTSNSAKPTSVVAASCYLWKPPPTSVYSSLQALAVCSPRRFLVRLPWAGLLLQFRGDDGVDSRFLHGWVHIPRVVLLRRGPSGLSWIPRLLVLHERNTTSRGLHPTSH